MRPLRSRSSDVNASHAHVTHAIRATVRKPTVSERASEANRTIR